MPTLLECLNHASYRRLWTIAQAHRLPPPQRHPPKNVWVTTLLRHLSDPQTIDHLCTQLGSAGQDALRVLLEAPQPILQHAFFARFGTVRPYRPWDKSAPGPDRPWHFPANPTERLWYLGLIYLTPPAHPTDPPRLCLPDELRQFLSDFGLEAKSEICNLALSEAKDPKSEIAWPSELFDTLHDLTILLALLQHFDITPLHRRWLSPRFLAHLNTHLAHPAPMPSLRSERHAGRLHFLHYLAEALRLVGHLGPYLKPTPAATLWFQADPAVRLQALWQTWLQPDLWRTYRLPAGQTPDPAAFVTHLLANLRTASPDAWLTVHDLLRDLARPIHDHPVWWQDPTHADVLPEALASLLVGPLRWLGLVETPRDFGFAILDLGLEDKPEIRNPKLVLERSEGSEIRNPEILAVRLTSLARLHLSAGSGQALAGSPLPNLPAPQVIAFTLTDDTLTLHVPAHPNLHHLFNLVALCGGTHLNPDGLALALERGYTLEGILRLLADAAGRPITAAEYTTLRRWAETPVPLTLRRLTVLEAQDPSHLAHLAARPAIRPLIRCTLNPRTLVVDHRRIPQLVARLRRLKYPPRLLIPDPSTTRPLDHSTRAYLYLAAYVYRQLSCYVDLPLTLPAAILDGIAASLTPETLADAQSLAEDTLARIHRAFDGYSDPPLDDPHPTDPAAVLPQLEAAIAAGTSITLTYWTAGRGELTHRTVDPYRIEHRAGVPYLVAYCHTRRAERVFRVDRIREVTTNDERPTTNDQRSTTNDRSPSSFVVRRSSSYNK